MSFNYIESVDLIGDTSGLTVKGLTIVSGSIVSSAGAFGGNAISTSGNTVNVYKTLDFKKYLTVSFFYKNTGGEAANILVIENKDIPTDEQFKIHCRVQVQGNGKILIFGDQRNFIGQSEDPVITPNSWHHIEVQVALKDFGSCAVIVDEVQAVFFRGDFESSLSIYSSVGFYGSSTATHLDDIVIQTSNTELQSLIGVHQIHALLPNADGITQDWTGSFADINDPLFTNNDGITTFISDDVIGEKAEFNMTSLPTSPTIVHLVSMIGEMEKSDAGAVESKQYILSGTSEEIGSTASVGTSFEARYGYHPTDPNNGLPWTFTTVNALIIGFEITA